jgi:fermentation-respiration switch protein FrsA (DUF1100 family)
MLTVAAAVLVTAVILALVWTLQRQLMYFPDAGVPSPGTVGLPGAETVTFATADGLSLGGWFIPSSVFRRADASASADRTPAATVLVFNGNAGNRAYRAPLATALQEHGLNVLLFDYRGYGGNAGSPTETGLAADARAARAYLTSRKDVDASRLIYLGESLGTGVAVALAAEEPPAALILRSPYTSMADVGAHHYPFLPVRLLLRDRFASADAIGRIRSALLVIAGDQDEVVPFEQSRRLFDAASSPKEFVAIPGASHNDEALLAGDAMIQAIVRFVTAHIQ